MASGQKWHFAGGGGGGVQKSYSATVPLPTDFDAILENTLLEQIVNLRLWDR